MINDYAWVMWFMDCGWWIWYELDMWFKWDGWYQGDMVLIWNTNIFTVWEGWVGMDSTFGYEWEWVVKVGMTYCVW